MGISITNVCCDLPKIVDKFYTERGILPWKIKGSPATPVSLDMEIYLSVTGWLVGWFDGWLLGGSLFFVYNCGLWSRNGKGMESVQIILILTVHISVFYIHTFSS